MAPAMVTATAAAPPASDPRKMPMDIVDIRNGQVDFDMKGDIISMMNPSQAQRSLPTMLLYDEKGLQLFEEVLPILVSECADCAGFCSPAYRSPISTNIT